MSAKSKRVLFLCLGNICRSPTAEAIFRNKAESLGLGEFDFDSAGTGDYHIGERSDHRSIRHAENRGYAMTHLARQIKTEDFHDFDFILTMDQKNLTHALGMKPEKHKAQVQIVTDFCMSSKHSLVPDPYYGTEKDFELVLDILEIAAEGFFKALAK